MIRKIRTILCLSLCVILAASIPAPALADTESELLERKASDSASLNSTNSEIESNESAQAALAGEISDLDERLVSLMSRISILSQDIAGTEQSIKDAEEDLAKAEAVRDDQYSSMKTRIQYIYERNEHLSWFSFLAASRDFIDFLNRIQYAQQINSYDRKLLNEYEQCVAEINALKDTLTASQGELMEEKGNLEEQQLALDESLNEKRRLSSDFEAELASLKARAEDLTEKIARETAALQEIELEKARKAEEEARRKAEEEAARQKAEEEARRKKAEEEAARQKAEEEARRAAESAAAAAEEEVNRQRAAEESEQARQAAEAEAARQRAAEEEAARQRAAEEEAARQRAAEEEAARQRAAEEEAARQRAAEEKAQASNKAKVWTRDEAFAAYAVAPGLQGQINLAAQICADARANNSDPDIGQRVIEYACQFLGNPYVLGGESLTNGCDCAGFAKEVYAHFGVYFPRNGLVIETLGIPVGSLAEAKPGDIIMYYGHTALYMGNDSIVNASCPELGICTRSPATYRSIYCIRRIFY